MKRKRIYEYVDEYGRTFWSFHNVQPPVSYGHTLTQVSRTGQYPYTYLLYLQKMISDSDSEE